MTVSRNGIQRFAAMKQRLLNGKKNGTRRKPTARIRKRRFLNALEDSAGIKQKIAERLGCARGTVDNLLNRKGWEDVRAAYEDEVDKVGDLAEETVRFAMKNRVDLHVASQNARWYLERMCKDRGFGKEEKLTLQGGDKPIEITQQAIPIEALDLPLVLRKQILQHLEDQTKEQEGEE